MKMKSDCRVNYTKTAQPLVLQLESSVSILYGKAIEKAARAVAAEFGVTTGLLTIQDEGALDYVIAARVEAALRTEGFQRKEGSSLVPAGRAAPEAAIAPGGRGLCRTRLYLPGNQPDILPNAALFGADCLVLDLEDSVQPAQKAEARILLRRALESHPGFFSGVELAVRINPLDSDWGRADLAELAHCLPDAVILPKCQEAAELRELSALLEKLEILGGKALGSTLILALIESARGILQAPVIATATPRLTALCFGAEDFARDIGIPRSKAGTETLYARQALVLAAKAAGLQAQDSVFSDTEDPGGLASYCAGSRALGFDGVGLVHPRQIGIAHAAFAPAEEERAEAERILKAFEEAKAQGKGVASLNGRMLDAPVVEQARRLLDRVLDSGEASSITRVKRTDQSTEGPSGLLRTGKGG